MVAHDQISMKSNQHSMGWLRDYQSCLIEFNSNPLPTIKLLLTLKVTGSNSVGHVYTPSCGGISKPSGYRIDSFSAVKVVNRSTNRKLHTVSGSHSTQPQDAHFSWKRFLVNSQMQKRSRFQVIALGCCKGGHSQFSWTDLGCSTQPSVCCLMSTSNVMSWRIYLPGARQDWLHGRPRICPSCQKFSISPQALCQAGVYLLDPHLFLFSISILPIVFAFNSCSVVDLQNQKPHY